MEGTARIGSMLGIAARTLRGFGWLAASLAWLVVVANYALWPYTMFLLAPLAVAAIIVLREVTGELVCLLFRVPRPNPPRKELYQWVHPLTTGMTAVCGWVVLEAFFSSFSGYDALEGCVLLLTFVSGALLLITPNWVLRAARAMALRPPSIFVGCSIVFLGAIAIPTVRETVFEEFSRSLLPPNALRWAFSTVVVSLLSYAGVVVVVLVRRHSTIHGAIRWG